MAFELMAPLMFAGLAIFLLLGYPVAFALAANGLLFAFIGFELGMLQPELLQALPQRLFGIMQNQLLLAIPFFTFMGLVLERSGMAEDLLDTIGQLFGPVRGGVAYAVIFVGALLAATTGVIAASVIAMGLISLPVMLRYGYSRRLASGVICASGTLAQIIPPSIVLIVLADVLGASVGDIYLGATVPSLALVGMLMLYVAIASFLKPGVAPALPPGARTLRGWPLYRHVLLVMVPPLALIFLVLGSIFMGIATPTEGGALGAVGSLALAWAKGRLNMKMLREALDSTTRLASFVMFILIGSTVFALTFRAVDGDLWVERLFSLVPGGVWGFIIVVNLLIFVLGFFIDFFEIAFILLPLLGPVAAKLGLDMVWFAVMVGINLQASFLTPPFGFALFYLRSVAPKEVKTLDIYRGIVPFVCVQLVALALVIAFPQLVTGMTGKGAVKDATSIEIQIPPVESAPGEETKPGEEDKASADIERAFREGK
ncbi:MAG: TRAP transporter large permease subunit [Betaproteobacteria bacterium]|nr:TRAP transporter large permease subunit [Betaproteobacteria bacterium]